MYGLGIYTDSKSLKIALLSKTKQGVHVELLRSFAPDEDFLHILQPILSGKKVSVSTGLETSEIFVRELSLQLTKRSAIYKALPFQLESIIPFSLDELILVPFFDKTSQKTTSVSLIASKRSFLENHLQKWLVATVDPDVVSCVPAALARFSDSQEPTLIFHVGEETTTYLLTSGNRILFSQSFHAHRESPQFRKEILRAAAFIRQKTPQPTSLILTGEDAPEISDILELSGKIPENAAYAIPIGLALEALAQDDTEVQLRQGPYISKGQVNTRKKLTFVYLASCLLLTGVLWIGGHLSIKKQETHLSERLHTYTTNSPDQPLATAIETWAKILEEKKEPFAYTFTVPKVSAILSWLSSHPNGKIRVTRLHYSLTKMPRITAEKEPYEAKIDLEFTASSPRHAREFHDALLAGDEYVNAQKAITWNANQNSYQTSFFLKSRPKR